MAPAGLWDDLDEDWVEQPPTSPTSCSKTAPSTTPPVTNSPQSRIPRPAKSRPPRPVALAERNVNVRSHSSSPRKATKVVEQPDTLARPFSSSSSRSVVHHINGSIVWNPQGSKSTPEWKAAAIRKQDLFSSMGLEQIFKKPEGFVNDRLSHNNYNLTDEHGSMPSSPPVIDSIRIITSLVQNTAAHVTQELHDIEEEKEELDEASVNGVNILVDQHDLSRPCHTDVKEVTYHQVKSDHHEGDCPALPRAVSTSSVANDFSPVYISKHNTVDGRVDYAAFDPSELPQLGEFVSRDRGGLSEDGSFRHRPLSPSTSSTALPSDSVAPSDSVSQIQPHLMRPVHSLAAPGKWLSPVPERERQSLARTGSEITQPPLQDPSCSHNASAATAVRAGKADADGAMASFEDQAHHGFTVNASESKSPPSKAPESKLSANNAQSEDFDSGLLSPNEGFRSIAGRKRKDARYDDRDGPCDPAIIANRDILRPRNATSGGHSRSSIPTGSDRRSSPQAEEIRARFEHDSSPVGQHAAKARVLASEVSNFRPQSLRARLTGPRQKSISTQDYLNEALMIMDLIRAKKHVPSDADSSDQVGQDADFNYDTLDSFTSQTISRPPSRDGLRTEWRTQANDHVDPQVLSHLKKYEETGDDSFLVKSIVHSVKAFERASLSATVDSDVSHEPFSNKSVRHRRFSNPIPGHEDYSQMSSPLKTQKSLQSTGSTQTEATTSTQRARNMTTIGPESVSHLIQQEAAGMRFDTNARSWVRQHHGKVHVSAIPSSSTGSDAKALNEIPDLSVNENIEEQRSRVFSGPHQPWPEAAPHPEDQESLFLDEDEEHVFEEQNTFKIEAPRAPDPSCGPDPSAHVDSSDNSEDRDAEILPTIEHHEDDVELLPIQSPRIKRRDQSVLFSSPPVSRAFDATQWTESTGPTHHGHTNLDDSELVQCGENKFTRDLVSPVCMERFSRSLSRIVESHEVSFHEAGPHGRTLSMSLSLCTPLPDRRSVTAPAQPYQGTTQQQKLVNSLSPLSAFTSNQDDERHKQSLALGKSILKLDFAEQRFLNARSARSTEDLVRLLMDAEPEEPYWEYMHRLSLTSKDLKSMHSLDAFCPRLEILHASHNFLEYLQGMPASLRELSLAGNQLSNATSWGHLQNLQYLDMSDNKISTLDGLGGLVHLRELKADNNQISSLSGIVDLDGLLALSLVRNELQSADFHNTGLKRVVSINLSGNRIASVSGVSALPALERLDLSTNRLSSFPVAEDASMTSSTLKTLNVSHNQISRLAIEGLRALHQLQADGNRLASIEGIFQHPALRRLFLRTQTCAEVRDLREFLGLEELHLHQTPLPPCLPVQVPFLRLRTLDISCTGVQALPHDFGQLVPSLQVLNLNSCRVKDLRPLEGIVGLRRLYCVGTRVTRLRSLMRVLKRLSSLRGGFIEQLDFRGTPVVQGFYESNGSIRSTLPRGLSRSRESSEPDPAASIFSDAEFEEPPDSLTGLIADANTQVDAKYADRLDKDTKMKRRVYELLLNGKCPRLMKLDGLELDRNRIERKDKVWDMLIDSGVLEHKGAVENNVH